jgi:hypothetical protein
MQQQRAKRAASCILKLRENLYFGLVVFAKMAYN